jgi:hypothetical protein
LIDARKCRLGSIKAKKKRTKQRKSEYR